MASTTARDARTEAADIHQAILDEAMLRDDWLTARDDDRWIEPRSTETVSDRWPLGGLATRARAKHELLGPMIGDEQLPVLEMHALAHRWSAVAARRFSAAEILEWFGDWPTFARVVGRELAYRAAAGAESDSGAGCQTSGDRFETQHRLGADAWVRWSRLGELDDVVRAATAGQVLFRGCDDADSAPFCMAPSQLESLLAACRRSIRVLTDGIFEPPERYDVPLSGDETSPLINTGRVLADLRSGGRALLIDAQLDSPLVADWTDELENVFGGPVRAIAMASGPNTDLGWHADTTHHFVAQVYGSKRWIVRTPVECAAAADNVSMCEDEFLLEPGDILFVPANVGHRVEGTSRSSVHITFACAPSSDGFLQVVPAGHRPATDGAFERTLIAMEVEPATRVQVRADQQPVVVDATSPAPGIAFGGRVVRVRPALLPVTTSMLGHTNAFSAADLGGGNETLELVRRLVAEGLLVRLDDGPGPEASPC